jgi:hypothetical protein
MPKIYILNLIKFNFYIHSQLQILFLSITIIYFKKL